MALESGTYVKDLVSTNPPGTDAISQGDDHIRLIKSVLKNSFPSNSNAPIVPDISGNGDKYLQVNSGASATQWVTLDVDALTRRKGEVNRATFEYVSGTSIKVYPGIYDMDNKGKNVSWDSTLTVTGLSGTDQWVYIYLDDNAISGTTVTASDIIGSTTVPTWIDSKHGWYNGDDRCIFAVYFNGSSISKFYHYGTDFVLYDEDFGEHSDYPVPSRNTWINIDIDRVPSFAMEVSLTWNLQSDGATTNAAAWFWRTKGSGSTGHRLGTTEAGSTIYDESHVATNIRTNVALNFADTTKNIEYLVSSVASNQDMDVYINGFYLPKGM
jgi:hypothetical protein